MAYEKVLEALWENREPFVGAFSSEGWDSHSYDALWDVMEEEKLRGRILKTPFDAAERLLGILSTSCRKLARAEPKPEIGFTELYYCSDPSPFFVVATMERLGGRKADRVIVFMPRRDVRQAVNEYNRTVDEYAASAKLPLSWSEEHKIRIADIVNRLK